MNEKYTKYAKLLLRRGPAKYAMMELVNHIIQNKPTSLAQIVGGLHHHLGNINRYDECIIITNCTSFLFLMKIKKYLLVDLRQSRLLHQILIKLNDLIN